VDGIESESESHPFHPETEDDWLMVHQATDPKRLSFTPFSRKGGREKALNSLSGFGYSQPS
jgi:hypothetical protein